jgi:cell division protein FtsA
MALRTPTQHAEEIKIRYACALAQLTGPEETIKVPSVGDRPPEIYRGNHSRRWLNPGTTSYSRSFRAKFADLGLRRPHPAGVVLTGGTSKMEGVVELAEEIFHMPVRVGAPQYTRGMHDIIRNPIYATAVGLLLSGAKELHEGAQLSADRQKTSSLLGGLRNWFGRNF